MAETEGGGYQTEIVHVFKDTEDAIRRYYASQEDKMPENANPHFTFSDFKGTKVGDLYDADYAFLEISSLEVPAYEKIMELLRDSRLEPQLDAGEADKGIKLRIDLSKVTSAKLTTFSKALDKSSLIINIIHNFDAITQKMTNAQRLIAMSDFMFKFGGIDKSTSDSLNNKFTALANAINQESGGSVLPPYNGDDIAKMRMFQAESAIKYSQAERLEILADIINQSEKFPVSCKDEVLEKIQVYIDNATGRFASRM